MQQELQVVHALLAHPFLHRFLQPKELKRMSSQLPRQAQSPRNELMCSAQPSAGSVPAQGALELPEMDCAVTCASLGATQQNPWPALHNAWTGNIIDLTDQWECTQLPSTGLPCSICSYKQNQGAVKKQEAAECLWRSGVCVDVFLLYKR